MARILVTGGRGALGRPTVDQLRTAGHDVRVLSRRSGPGLTTADLLTGHGVRAALSGVDTVVHLATGARDTRMTETLLHAARSAAVTHLVHISIVGVDRIPLPYYRWKLASEGVVATSGVPHTILRATQFHQLVAGLFRVQRRSPILLAPAFALQPIDVRDVATRLVELCGNPGAGRVADIGGPEIRTGTDLARAWQTSVGGRRPIRPVTLPGRTFAAYRAGHHLVPGPPYGRRTFADYLADPTGPAA